jgi:hypothetical protein
MVGFLFSLSINESHAASNNPSPRAAPFFCAYFTERLDWINLELVGMVFFFFGRKLYKTETCDINDIKVI